MGKAQLVAVGGAVVGGAIGSFFGPGGAALGAQIGFAAGSIAGNAAFPPEALINEGPRLGDLATSTSTYGIPRPIGFGSMRQGGNMIWALPIREKKKKSKVSGGKGLGGGQPQKNITYSYFGTFAYAFGEGPAEDVLRIWADNKLIFDKTSLSNITKKAGLTFRFYPGNSTQLPDPAMEADKGVGNTPAYRGTVYIVFDDLALADFGNRFPNITAEIAYTKIEARISQSSIILAGPLTTFQTDAFGVDWIRGFAYLKKVNSDPNLSGIRKFRLSDMREVQQSLAINAIPQVIPAANSSFQVSGFPIIVTPDGDLITGVGAANSIPLVLLDGNTMREKGRFGIITSALNNSSTQFELVTHATILTMLTQAGHEAFVLTGSIFNSAGLLRIGNNSLTYVWDSDTDASIIIGDNSISAVCPGRIGEQITEGYIRGDLGSYAGSSPIHIYRVRIESGISIGLLGPSIFTTVKAELILTLTPGDLFPGGTTFSSGGAGNLLYDSTDDTIILSAKLQSGVNKWVKYNPSTGAKIWETENFLDSEMPIVNTLGEASVLMDGTFGYFSSTQKGILINTVTGETLFKANPPSYPASPSISFFHTGYYNSRNETFVGPSTLASTGVGRWFFRRNTADDVPIGDIITSIVERIGLTSADIDVTSLAGVTTPGFMIGRQTSARAAIQAMSLVYLFDGVESDHIIKFVRRGGAPVLTLNTDHFIPTSSGQVYEYSRAQEVELPQKVSLNYLDRDGDFLPNSHSVKRISILPKSSFSDNQVATEYPGALRANFAKQTAEKILFLAWIERNRYVFQVPWSYLALDPSDVILLPISSTKNIRGRITVFDIGVDYTINMGIVQVENDQFTSTAQADSGSGQPIQTVEGATFVFLRLLDIPLLRDIDEITGRIANPIYGLMGSMESGQFKAGTVFVGLDGVNYDDSTSFVSEMNWGTVTNTLGDHALNDQLDEVNTITVRPINGEEDLESISQLALLNGGNPAAILKGNGEVELLQYRDVADNGDGTYTLSNLLRGRRGTELMATGHTPNELIIFLIPVDIEIFVRPLTDLNTMVFYKAVGSNQLFEDGQVQVLTSQHRALKPYAVTHIKAQPGASSSVDFSWVRRTRVGGALLDGLGTVPLNEDTEEYELEIFDGPGGALVRTVTGLTSPAYNYSSADQIIDGFTPMITSVTLQIYQLSAQVGRGFSQEMTINVE